jgi:hypothetical protein
MPRTHQRDGGPLSVPACRRLLGAAGEGLSDAEVARIRDRFYAVAHCAVEAYIQDGSHETEPMVLAALPADVREDVEERAAVLQYDARLSRGLATRVAVASRLGSVKKDG